MLGDVFQWSALPFIVLVALLVPVSIVGGRDLPHWLRTSTSVIVVYWAFSMCLIGRTMEPGLTAYTASWATKYFVLFGLVPLLALLRLWRLPIAAIAFAAACPFVFALAFTVAHLEEAAFVECHREHGVGPTPRWLVPMHWLAYDASTGELRGSD